MKHTGILKILTVLFCLGLSANLFAEDHTPEPYHDNEFPQVLKDIRRFEIITLGALPFVTLQTTLGYSCYQYVNHDFSAAYFPNPFAASSYSQDEQIGILLTSLGICVGIGLTDLIIQLVKRSNAKKRANIMDSDLMIQPVENIKMPVPPEGGFPPPPPEEEKTGDQ
ncbi:hypothetical protein [Treponema sp. C6A8]|uniref:hypothetical protein n=1 Tax=Treponema sp. C6A8 TaxID=1410609 RepID=UPI00056E1D99|nr:hypothetical protein [Treponema sp. C6A8]